jgi:hypothetical protein
MKLVAWYPEGLSAPPELTSVKLPLGKVNHKQWVEALSDRVSQLAQNEPNPEEASLQACRLLDLPLVENPAELGQNLVQNNLNLLTYLNVAEMKENPFQEVKESNPLAEEALKNVDLASWVELALSQVSESSLDS